MFLGLYDPGFDAFDLDVCFRQACYDCGELVCQSVFVFLFVKVVQSPFHPMGGGSMPICQSRALNSPLW